VIALPPVGGATQLTRRLVALSTATVGADGLPGAAATGVAVTETVHTERYQTSELSWFDARTWN
jgi:hypothetical protein